VALRQVFVRVRRLSPWQYHSTVAVHTHLSSGAWTIGRLLAAVQRRGLTSSTWRTTYKEVIRTALFTGGGMGRRVRLLFTVLSRNELLKTPVFCDISYCETSVNFFETTRHNFSEGHLHSRRRENLKSH
jgi:hypothetical protein